MAAKVLADLVLLVRVAREDEGLHERLLHILQLPHQDRLAMLAAWQRDLRNDGHSDFASAVGTLVDPLVAAQALKQIQGQNPTDNFAGKALKVYLASAGLLVLAIVGGLWLVSVSPSDHEVQKAARFKAITAPPVAQVITWQDPSLPLVRSLQQQSAPLVRCGGEHAASGTQRVLVQATFSRKPHGRVSLVGLQGTPPLSAALRSCLRLAFARLMLPKAAREERFAVTLALGGSDQPLVGMWQQPCIAADAGRWQRWQLTLQQDRWQLRHQQFATATCRYPRKEALFAGSLNQWPTPYVTGPTAPVVYNLALQPRVLGGPVPSGDPLVQLQPTSSGLQPYLGSTGNPAPEVFHWPYHEGAGLSIPLLPFASTAAAAN